MSPLLIVVYSLAGAMLVGAGILVRAGRRRAVQEVTKERFDKVAFASAAPPVAAPEFSLAPSLAWLAGPLLRAGIVPRPWHPWALAGLLLLLLLLLLVGARVAGLVGALGCALVLGTAAYAYLLLRASGIRQRMVSQLPGFIDAVLRAVAAGRNLENAISASRDHTPMPLRGVFDRVLRRVQLGGDLGEGLDEARRIYRLRELALLRLVVIMGQRYGGSVKEPLGNVATLIRQYEQNQREVRAMTGEVRLSAWLLGLLPLGVAAYVLAVNPNYLQFMLGDSSGRMALLVAALMQVAGALLLWRMVKTVL